MIIQIVLILIGACWYSVQYRVIPDVRGGDSAHPRVSVSVDLPLVRSFCFSFLFFFFFNNTQQILRVKD